MNDPLLWVVGNSGLPLPLSTPIPRKGLSWIFSVIRWEINNHVYAHVMHDHGWLFFES